MKQVCFLLFACISIGLVSFCDSALKKGDPGVCEFKKQIKAKSCSGRKCPPQKKTTVCCDKWEYVRKSNSCRPQCEEKCVNALCTAPGTCTCNHSYHKHNSTHCVPDCDDGFRNNEDTFACEPICDNSCINGTCTAPNTCTCFDGYEPDTPNSCKPQCHSCENGQCVEPNKCECITGYTLQNATCAPFCENNCTNGWCSGPNECSCDSGYEKHGNDCKPKCDLKCVNSFCSAPNVCTCEHGYEKVNGICEPKCDPECVNGFCSEPNVCSCYLGYEAEAGDAFRCRAVCTPACINSTCQSPGSCSCLPGYETTAHNWVCKPKCSSQCENGECVSPDECRCNEGYNLFNGECSPKCEQECLNGYCSSPDRCTCHEGFVQNETDSFKCYVPCKNCDAGTCVNGTCVCDTGFEYNDGCRLKMSVECGSCNGSCIQDVCRCANGDTCFTSRMEDPSSSPLLASFDMAWVISGAVLIFLFVSILLVIGTMAVRKNKSENISFSDANNGSIAYTVPDTLLVRSDLPRLDENYEMDENFPENTTDGVTNEKLLQPNTFIEKSY